MSKNRFSLLAGLIFLLVAIAHLARIVLGRSVIINGWAIPMWVSAIAPIVSGLLAFEGLRRHS